MTLEIGHSTSETHLNVSHLHYIIEDLIEDVDEDLISNRLQTGGAVISIWSTEIKGKRLIHTMQILKLNVKIITFVIKVDKVCVVIVFITYLSIISKPSELPTKIAF